MKIQYSTLKATTILLLLGGVVSAMNACADFKGAPSRMSARGGAEAGGAGSPFQCSDSSANLSSVSPTNAKRLSVRQYRNTLIDLLSIALTRDQASSIVTAALNAHVLPTDSGQNFPRENNVFSGDHADSFFNIADNIALSVSQNHSSAFVNRFIELAPSACTSVTLSNLSTACRSQLVKNFASRAFRRPLREASHRLTTTSGEAINELGELVTELNAATTQAGLSQLIFRVLYSPHFLFQIEDQDLARPHGGAAGVYQLSSFAIASRLSYRFWNTLPDETLVRLASQEDLAVDNSFSKALEHVISRTDKLDDSLREYYHGWLKLGRTPNFSPNGRFNLIASGIAFDGNLRSAMISEVEELGSYVTTSGGGFEDLFTTDVSFARTDNLMAIYGLSQRAPAAITDATAVRFPQGERAGLLTRAALLISGNETASPIMRGAHLRKDILCLPLGSAPANALSVFESTHAPHNISTRDKVAIKTSGSSCVGCHSLINPLGFGLSNYNAFGMYQASEPIFSPNGNFIEGHVAVDSRVDLSSLLGSGATSNDAIQLSQAVAEQQSAKACFTEKFVSYSLGRDVDRRRDACRLESAYRNLGRGGRLMDMLRASAFDLEMRYRKIEGQ